MSTLFAAPGVRLEHIAVDSMHAGDLGVFQDFVGSVIDLELRHYHANMADGLRNLNDQLDAYYRADPSLSKASPLSSSQLTDSDGKYPTLKSKAAECRHITGFIRVVARKHAVGNDLVGPCSFGPDHRLHSRANEHLDALLKCAEALDNYHQDCAEIPFQSDRCKASLMVFSRAIRFSMSCGARASTFPMATPSCST